jgi:hypothetical protein
MCWQVTGQVPDRRRCAGFKRAPRPAGDRAPHQGVAGVRRAHRGARRTVGSAAAQSRVLGKELDKRLHKLEQALPGVRSRAPFWEDFERRCRIADLYRAWWFEGGNKPHLNDLRDEHWWRYLEEIRKVIDEMVAEGALSPNTDER